LQIGIVGLPNVGKTTFFKALTRTEAETANYPFTTTSYNTGVAELRDERLDKIAQIVHSKEVIPTTIKFLDVAGLVKGASKGEGLGNQFLGYLRGTDALVEVVRCFKDADVSHVEGRIQPQEDIEIVNLELALADLATVERRLQKVKRQAKSGDKESSRDLEILERLEGALNQGFPIRNLDLGAEKSLLLEMDLLTTKPLIYMANISESDIGVGNLYLDQVQKKADADRNLVIPICAKLEAELSELSPGESKLFLREMGIQERGLDKLIRACYKILGLITFYTIESQISQAWAVKKGTKVPQAAGAIHSDMEEGFIKAEVASYEDLVSAGSFVAAREKGHLLLEGKEYIVRDGDVLHFKFRH